MKDYFRESFEHMKRALEEMQTANQHLIEAGQAMGTAFDDELEDSLDEHNDLREMVTRLEGLVMEQGKDIRALGDEVRGLRRDLEGSVR